MSDKPGSKDTAYDWIAAADANFNVWLQAVRLSRVVQQRMDKLAGSVPQRRLRREAEAQIMDEIMRGEYDVYARDVGISPTTLDQIGPQFFVGLSLDSKRDAAIDDRDILLDVRLVPRAQAGATQSAKATVSKERKKSGPKSQEVWIRLAIAKAPSRHPRWTSFNLAQRVAAYMAFLARETEAVTSERGFNAKTFAKFEKKVRDETGH